MARILFTTFGSFGDLHPYLAIGLELQRRGHRVTIATSEGLRAKVETEGIGFHAVRPDVSLEDRAQMEQFFDARRGSERIIRSLSAFARESAEDTQRAAENADLIVTHMITFAAAAVAEKSGLPWISNVLAPFSLLSAYDVPVLAAAPWAAHLRVFGPAFMRRFYSMGRRQSRAWVQPVLDLRQGMGLPASHPLFEGMHSPRLVLGLFSRFLMPSQPDWPAQTIVTGFPFYEPNGAASGLSAELRAFFEAGPAPIVFTLGSSAVGAAGDFYRASLEATCRLGARAVLLTGPHLQGLPSKLPESVIAVDYASHSLVFPRASAIVHQGGIGTTAQAMRSARPMLVVPFAHDQYDNAERVRRLGMGEVIPKPRYTVERAERALRTILQNPAYARTGETIAASMREEHGADSAADAIESVLD